MSDKSAPITARRPADLLAYLSLAGTLSRHAERVDMSADDADWWPSGLVDGRLPDQRLDGRHPHDAPRPAPPRLRPVSLRPGHLIRRHRNERPLQLHPLIAPRPAPAGQSIGGAIVTAQAGTMDRLTWLGQNRARGRARRVAEPAGGRWRPTSMRPLSLTVPVRARQMVVAAAVVAVATACGTGLSAGHASAAGHGHPAASGRPAAVSDGIAGARHRGAVPQRWILPCRPAGGTRHVAATACRVPPRAPLPSPARGGSCARWPSPVPATRLAGSTRGPAVGCSAGPRLGHSPAAGRSGAAGAPASRRARTSSAPRAPGRRRR
jgi:hypothetical protein